MEKFWIVYVEGSAIGKPVKHLFKTAADEEAKRLARLPNVNGATVYVLETIAYCQLVEVLPPVIYHRME